MYNSFYKYGILKHKFSIIEDVKIQDLCTKEIYYIEYFNSFLNGLNLTKGGEGTLGKKMTDENKIKLRNANKNKVYTEEYKLRMSKARKGQISNRKGVVLSEETRDKIRKAKLGIKASEETKRKMSVQRTGKSLNISEKGKQSLKENAHKHIVKSTEEIRKLCKIILQYTIDDVFIRETTRIDLRLEGYSIDAIKQCLLNKNKTSQGFKWKYKN